MTKGAVGATPTYDNKDLILPKGNKKYVGKFGSWWIIPAFIISSHVVAFFVLFTRYLYVPVKFYIGAMLYGFISLLGITGGYHRLWSHHSYHSPLVVRMIWAFLGAMSFQGSIKWWVLRHRVHHRWTDTKFDPYNSKRGFWYTHLGWLLENPAQNPKFDLVDLSDLRRDPVVEFQAKYIGEIYMFLLVAPALVGYLMGDAMAGTIWIGIFGRMIGWHGIFSVNSFSHFYGDAPYQLASSAKNSLFVALISNGEGNHNYHHEFPQDYRHGFHWYEWDPTKWTIDLLAFFGLATKLKSSPADHIEKSELQMQEAELKAKLDAGAIGQGRFRTGMAQLQAQKAKLYWGPEDASLPTLSMEEFKQQCADDYKKQWFVIDDYVIDYKPFAREHPGGMRVLHHFRGCDATHAFKEGLNTHTNAAHNMMRLHRVAKLRRTGRAARRGAQPQ